MVYFFSDDLRICQMVSFPLINIADSNIDLLLPYIPKMIDNYANAPHDSYKRNVVRILQFVDIPEDLEGKVFDICLEEFCNTKTATAIRVFSITVLVNICEKHPELKQEVLPILMDYQITGTVGFENRLGKEINRLRKISPFS